MSSFVKTCAVIAALGLLSQVAAAAEGSDVSLEKEVAQYVQYATAAGESNPNAMNSVWKTGIRWTSADKRHQVKLNGRLMWDTRFGSSDDYPGDALTQDTTFFRRVRLAVAGHAYENVIFKVQVDFAKGDEVALKDVYVGLKNLPKNLKGTVKFGHFKEPFSLEELTSSKYITFMERAMVVNAFSPSRNSGIAYWMAPFEQRMTVGVGVFRPTDDAGSVMSNEGYAFTIRVTGLPLENDDMVLHLGFAASYRSTTSGNTARFRARPGTGSGNRVFDTSSINGVDNYFLLGGEIAYVWKGLHVQGEFIMATVDGGGDPSFFGWYFQVGYFIFGEMRPYKKSSAAFDKIKPENNLMEDGGWGAIEVAYRIDFLDLSDSGTTGGEGYTHTIGINWYWNPNTRVMFNFIYLDVTSPSSNYGEGNAFFFQMRFQFFF
jgi:phosphate-selective porin OprO/OprP